MLATLQNEIRAELAERNFTATYVSEQTGISETSLSRFLNNKRGIEIESLEKLMNFLKLDILVIRQG